MSRVKDLYIVYKKITCENSRNEKKKMKEKAKLGILKEIQRKSGSLTAKLNHNYFSII